MIPKMNYWNLVADICVSCVIINKFGVLTLSTSETSVSRYDMCQHRESLPWEFSNAKTLRKWISLEHQVMQGENY